MKLRSEASEAILQRDIDDLRKEVAELKESNQKLLRRNVDLNMRHRQTESELADIGLKVELKPATEAKYIIKKR